MAQHRQASSGPDDHDRGLSFDMSTLVTRRRALTVLGGAGLAAGLAACGATGGSDSSGTSATTATTDASSSTTADSSSSSSSGSSSIAIPEETAGPYPGDGTNGPNVLTESGIVRRDITKSFGSSSGVADGIPTTVALTLLETANGSAPLSGAAVYVWHCNRVGEYSLYSQAITGENYLRGVQETDDGGNVTFTTIFPGAYAGRWLHIHFEVYPSLSEATSAGTKLRTSQLALPENVCSVAYEADGYEQSVQNLAQTSLSTDMVFSDGWSLQLATVTGSNADGYTAKLDVPV